MSIRSALCLAAAVLASPAAAQIAPVYQDSGGRNVGATGIYTISRSSLATGQVSVGTNATLIVPARSSRVRLILSPTSPVVYYVGGSTVAPGAGVYVAAGASITIDTSAAVYAVGASPVVISYAEMF
jgi:hypothetical protein